MTHGLGSGRYRQKRRRGAAVLKWSAGLIVIAAAGSYAYRTGSDLARQEVIALEADMKELSETNAALTEQDAKLRAANSELQLRQVELERRYGREVPTGTRKRLLELIDERLRAGVTAERLASLVAAAEDRRTCEGDPITKRFLVRTPLYQGPNDSVSFADNAITVTAEGRSAINPNGNPEAWFDPAKPVTIRFVRLGGSRREASGLLPLHGSVAIDETEYRFTVIAGERPGFVKVAGQGCRYP